MIRKLDPESVRQLGSTEIVVSPTSVVKELVENALDSGACRIAVKLEDYGLGLIEVSDNGCGIDAQSMVLMGERHCTSKATSAADLMEGKVETYGFRGEALASIATVASQLSIATCCHEEAQGRRYVFDPTERHFSMPPVAVAMQSGTVVTVTGLFAKLPVRRDYYAKSKMRCRETLSQCRHIVAALSLCRLNCRFSLKHVGNASSIWESSAGLSVPTLLTLIAGPLVSAGDFECLKVEQLLDSHQLECYLPSPAKCLVQDRQSLLFRNSPDSLFIIVNNRPVNDRDFAAVVKSCYVESGLLTRGAYPIGSVRLTVPRQLIDANVDVAKQLVFFGSGKEFILEAVKSKLNDFLKMPVGDKSVGIAEKQLPEQIAAEDIVLQGDNDEPSSKKDRRGYNVDQWSRGCSFPENRQPVQIVMPRLAQEIQQPQTNWTASLTRLHQQNRKRKQEQLAESTDPPVVPCENIVEAETGLSKRISQVFMKHIGRIRHRPIPEEVTALISTRPSQPLTVNNLLTRLRSSANGKSSNTDQQPLKEVGQVVNSGKLLLFIDSKAWQQSKNRQESLIACSLNRLHEAALFANLMASAQISKRNLGHNFSIGRFVSSEQLQFLTLLPSKPSNPPLFKTITDPRLVSNGFKLRVYSNSSRSFSSENLNNAAAATAPPVNPSYYIEVEQGPEIPEPNSLTTPNAIGPVVAEIVETIMTSQQNTIASSRPRIIVDYLRSEVDRLTKLPISLGGDQQLPEQQTREFLQQILMAAAGDRTSLLSVQCPHSKPLFCYCPLSLLV